MPSKASPKNTAKYAEAKARVAEQKGKNEGSFTEDDWRLVNSIYGDDGTVGVGLKKIASLGGHAGLNAPAQNVGSAALAMEGEIKAKAKSLGKKFKKKKLNKSDKAKILLYKAMIEDLKND